MNNLKSDASNLRAREFEEAFKKAWNESPIPDSSKSFARYKRVAVIESMRHDFPTETGLIDDYRRLMSKKAKGGKAVGGIKDENGNWHAGQYLLLLTRNPTVTKPTVGYQKARSLRIDAKESTGKEPGSRTTLARMDEIRRGYLLSIEIRGWVPKDAIVSDLAGCSDTAVKKIRSDLEDRYTFKKDEGFGYIVNPLPKPVPAPVPVIETEPAQTQSDLIKQAKQALDALNGEDLQAFIELLKQR